MINPNHLPEKLLNYIHNRILSKRKNRVKLRHDFYIQIFTAIALFTFFVGITFSNIVSYLTTNLVLKKNSFHFNLQENINTSIISTPYSIIQKSIMARNIFNSEGNIPYEDTPEGNEESFDKNFEKAPCSKSEKLPIEIIGIVYTGNPSSNLVTLKDPKVTLSDVYKEGQKIIDYESYILYKVTSPISAEFRHERRKICVSLDPSGPRNEGSFSTSDMADRVAIPASYIAEQLGPGFSTILNSARLVPQIIDGKTTGFKIFSITKDSLFDKIKLIDGDVIKNINGINLEDSSQGFKIYEAFQDENNITLQIERNGEILNKKVTVQ